MAQTQEQVVRVDEATFPPAGTYQLDLSHTNAEFVARHMLSKVRGRFTDLSGAIEVGARPEDSRVDVEIRTASVETDDAKRDEHLRSEDFFETEAFPTITFRSTAVRPTGGEGFELDGDLTIKDVTRPVTLAGTFLGWGQDMWGNDRLFAEASTRVNREDWGLTWNVAVEIGGVLVSKEIDLEISVEAAKPSDA